MPFVLSGSADLLAATGGHPYVRFWIRHGHTDLRSWTSRGATVWSFRDCPGGTGGEVDVVGFGPPQRVAALVDQTAHLLSERADLSVPRGTEALLTGPVQLGEPAGWEFRWTTQPPPRVAGEQAVAVLPGSADAEIAALLDRSSDRPAARPGDPRVRRWMGIREAGALVAVAADTSAGDVGYISAVATEPTLRRQGWGAAVTAHLTRLLLAEFGLATLALYDDNAPARRLYVRLGYDREVQVTSGHRVPAASE